jgi:hypothetical protein
MALVLFLYGCETEEPTSSTSDAVHLPVYNSDIKVPNQEMDTRMSKSQETMVQDCLNGLNVSYEILSYNVGDSITNLSSNKDSVREYKSLAEFDKESLDNISKYNGKTLFDTIINMDFNEYSLWVVSFGEVGNYGDFGFLVNQKCNDYTLNVIRRQCTDIDTVVDLTAFPALLIQVPKGEYQVVQSRDSGNCLSDENIKIY